MKKIGYPLGELYTFIVLISKTHFLCIVSFMMSKTIIKSYIQ